MRPHIAFDRLGEGSPVILVLGAFNTRATGAPLAAALAANHTVINYDRRGRGGSGDRAPYAVEREIEDLDGLIQRAGGAAAVFGFSSGAALALAAGTHGLAITRLALFDLPLMVQPPALPVDHAAALDALVRAGRRGEAVEYFQRRMVGLPEPVIAQLRDAPFRPELEAMAHTLVYEAMIVGDGHLPLDRARALRPPTLAIAAGKAPPFMRETAEALARAAPGGTALVLEQATHDLVPELLAPPLLRFFADASAPARRSGSGRRPPASRA
ncbi:MAG TPA: alpha/beta fold hydrolase [Kofleriaceae bacterium]|nr:alpha/beta fold hydrolase [Kofleriaceae bacterium]